MKMQQIFETNEISYATQDDFAVLTLKAGAFNVLIKLEAKHKVLELFTEIDQSPEIKGLVLINTADYPGDEKYLAFLRNIMQDESGRSYEHGIGVARMRHAMEHLTLQAINFSKPMVAGLQGRITGEFFGNVLPFDFRFATEDTVLMFPNVQLGFPPSGGLAYYLNRFIGPAKATEILMLGRELSASDAENLGLLTSTTTPETLLETCLDTLDQVCRTPPAVLDCIRGLLHPETKEVEDYLHKAFDTAWHSLSRLGKVDTGHWR